MPRQTKKPKPPVPAEPEDIILPSDALKRLVAPDTFCVWNDSHDPSSNGEYVVTISPEGVRVWESYRWHPSKLNATDDHYGGHYEAHEGFLLTWPEVVQIGGRGNELVAGIRDEIEEIERELAYWAGVRSKEAQRIQRAREVERQANMRHLLFRADAIINTWMPPGRKRVTWRDMVKRRRE